ncbi:MAG TPA: NAD-dependent epimerase/dehydratase family protein [Armatimonadetes bacterium]|nr:NAD-dependent epimerase/dehydratase family protein [Armatimonadota bacterium]
MKVLITGGAGFIGAQLAFYLRERGHEVIVLDNLVRRGSELNLPLFKRWGIPFYHGDVRNAEDFVALPRDIEVICETCAQPSAIAGYDNPIFDITNNTLGLMHTLEFARECGAAVIFWSTNKVYSGDRVNAFPRREAETRWVWDQEAIQRQYGDHLPPGFDPRYGFSEEFSIDGGQHSIYGLSKVMADLACQEYYDAFGVKTVVNRFSCLAGDTKIETMGGTLLLRNIRQGETVRTATPLNNGWADTSTGAFRTSGTGKTLWEIRTKRGRVIRATGDHLFYCPGGYKPVEKIECGQLVEVHPTVERQHYSELPDQVILSPRDFQTLFTNPQWAWPEGTVERCLQDLKRRHLDRISYRHPMIYVLARLVGYAFGDGHLELYNTHRSDNSRATVRATVRFYDKDPLNLRAIQEDIRRLGFNCGEIRSSRSPSEFNGKPIDGWSTSFTCGQRAFVGLMYLLGVPRGRKAEQAYRVPSWVREAPGDVKAEFLRGFFGAELRCPTIRNGELSYVAYTQSKRESLADAARAFNEDIATMLAEWDIETSQFETYRYQASNGEWTRGYELRIKQGRENIACFAEKIGYAYNRERMKACFHIAEFLKTGLPIAHYEEWIADMTKGISHPDSAGVWDWVVEKRPVEREPVYDLTVPETENFIANGFHVHNCLAGKGQFGKSAQGWVAWWALAFYFGRPLKYIGWKGKQVRDVLFIEDICRLVELQMEHLEDIAGEVFNIGGGMKYTLSLREATALLEEKFGRSVPVELEPEPRKADQCIYISDIRKAEKLLGWAPTIGIPEGYDRIIAWIKENEAALRQLYLD